jgi:hypothetical protein
MSGREQHASTRRSFAARVFSSRAWLIVAGTVFASAVALTGAQASEAVASTGAAVWVPRCESGCTLPSPRRSAPMAYDGSTGTVVLVAGYDSDYTQPTDTWTWNGSAWTRQSPPTSPRAAPFGAMAYDEATKTVVLFTAWGETWLWSGARDRRRRSEKQEELMDEAFKMHIGCLLRARSDQRYAVQIRGRARPHRVELPPQRHRRADGQPARPDLPRSGDVPGRAGDGGQRRMNESSHSYGRQANTLGREPVGQARPTPTRSEGRDEHAT